VGESKSANVHVQSTAADDQRDMMDDDDLPRTPLEPPPLLTNQTAPPAQENKLPNVKLEGERVWLASCNAALTRDEADALGALGHDEDPRKRPMKPLHTSEQAHTQLEQGEEKNPPYGLQVEPDKPVGEAAIPGDVYSPKERPRCS